MDNPKSEHQINNKETAALIDIPEAEQTSEVPNTNIDVAKAVTTPPAEPGSTGLKDGELTPEKENKMSSPESKSDNKVKDMGEDCHTSKVDKEPLLISKDDIEPLLISKDDIEPHLISKDDVEPPHTSKGDVGPLQTSNNDEVSTAKTLQTENSESKSENQDKPPSLDTQTEQISEQAQQKMSEKGLNITIDVECSPGPLSEVSEASTIDSSTPKVSRELKSLIESAKESKIISESTQIKTKMRNSRGLDFSISQMSPNTSIESNKIEERRDSSTSLKSNSSDTPGKVMLKRSMRSQNPDFVNKQKKFLSTVTGKESKDTEGKENKEMEVEEMKTPKLGANMMVDGKLKHDPYCWKCHWEVEFEEKTTWRCNVCPRSYHQKCLSGVKPSETKRWACPECVNILNAENSQTRSPAMRKITLPMLHDLLKFTLQRLTEVAGVEPFLNPVDRKEFPQYDQCVVRPMDLNTIKQNIEGGVYGSTDSFLADVTWILHNSIIFNSMQSRLTAGAKALLRVCRVELSEIEACPECYAAAHRRRPTWFTDVCTIPHILVWAKLKGFPFWPAKVMSHNNSTNQVDVRFFGAHDRAWVPVKEVFLYSREDPNAYKTKRQDISQSVEEAELYIENLRRKFGGFKYPEFKIQYDPARAEEQLKIMLPDFKGEIPKQSKRRDLSTDSPSSNKTSSPHKPGARGSVRNEGVSDDDGAVSKRLRRKMSSGADIAVENEEDMKDKELDVEMDMIIVESRSPSEARKRKNLTEAVISVVDSPKKAKLVHETAEQLIKHHNLTNKKPGVKNSAPTQIKKTDTSQNEKSDSPAIEKSVTPQRKISDTPEINESVKPQRKKSDTAEVNECVTLQRKKSAITEINKSGTPQGKKSDTPEINKSGTPQGKKSDTPEINKSGTPQGKKSDTPEINKSGTPQGKKSDTPEINKSGTPQGKKSDTTEINKSVTPQRKKSDTPEIKKDSSQKGNSIKPCEDKGTSKPAQNTSEKQPEATRTRETRETARKSTTQVFKSTKELRQSVAPTKSKDKNDTPPTLLGNARDRDNETPKKEKVQIRWTSPKTTPQNIKIVPANNMVKKVVENVPKDNPPAADNSKTNKDEHGQSNQRALPKITHVRSLADSDAAPLSKKAVLVKDAKKSNATPQERAPDKPPPSISVRSFARDPGAARKSSKDKSDESKGEENKGNRRTSNFTPVTIKSEPVDVEICPTKNDLLSSLELVPTNRVNPPRKQLPTNNSQSKKVFISDRRMAPPAANLATRELWIEEELPASTIEKPTTRQNSSMRTIRRTTAAQRSNLNGTNSMVYIPIHPAPVAKSNNTTTSTKGSTVPTQTITTVNTSTPVHSTSNLIVTNGPTLTVDATAARTTVHSTQSNVASQPAMVVESGRTPVTVNGLPENAGATSASGSAGSVPPCPPLMRHPFDPTAPVSSVVPIPSAAGPLTELFNQNAVKLTDFFRNLLLSSLEYIDDPVATIQKLKMQIEELKFAHKQEISEINHNTELMVKEMANSVEKVKVKAIAETRKACDQELAAAVEFAKSRQWCANCRQEAQFYCCWNTSYCDYPCQQKHWPRHFATCKQNTGSSSDSITEVSRPPLVRPAAMTANKQNYTAVSKGQLVRTYHARPGNPAQMFVTSNASANIKYVTASQVGARLPQPALLLNHQLHGEEQKGTAGYLIVGGEKPTISAQTTHYV